MDLLIDWLKSASIFGDINEVKRLEEKGVDIHADDDIAFRLACGHGRLNLVKYLLGRGVDIHVKSDWGIRTACGHGCWKVIFFLLENGADIYADHGSALYWASGNGHIDVVKYLVEEKGFFIDEGSMVNACTEGHILVFEYLYNKNIPDNFAYSFFLNFILRNGGERHLLVAKFLMEKGGQLDEEFGKEEVMQKIQAYERKRVNAVNKIGTWWIRICYDVNRECGKRMMERSWKRVEEMYRNKED